MTKSNSKRKALTAMAINKMRPGDELGDTGENTGLRVTKNTSGHRYWYRYTHPTTGKQVALHIAYGDEMSLNKVRDVFAVLRKQRKRGLVPMLPRQEQSPEAENTYTVDDLVSDHLAGVAERRTEKAANEARRILTRLVLPKYGSQPAAKLTLVECKAIADGELSNGHHAQAGVVLRELAAAIGVAVFDGKLPQSYGNPAKMTLDGYKNNRTRMTANRGKRYLSDNELRKFFAWLPDSGFSPKQRIALELTLRTGCRTGEAISAAWDDFAGGVWQLHKNKTDCPRDIKLAASTVKWLESLELTRSGDYLCQSPKAKTHIQQKSLTETMWRMRTTATLIDIAPWVPHDLRRTVRTGLSRLGCPKEVAEAILGHSKRGIEGVYDLHEYYEEAGAWLEKWNIHLNALRPVRQTYLHPGPSAHQDIRSS